MSLFNQLPPPFLTTTIDAACMPRVSPPAAWPASSAAMNRIDRCPLVSSNALIIASTTWGPARMLPCAAQYLPSLPPAHAVAFGPVNVAASPFKFITANWRPCLVQRSRSEEHTSELQSQSNLVCRLLL